MKVIGSHLHPPKLVKSMNWMLNRDHDVLAPTLTDNELAQTCIGFVIIHWRLASDSTHAACQ